MRVFFALLLGLGAGYLWCLHDDETFLLDARVQIERASQDVADAQAALPLPAPTPLPTPARVGLTL